MISNGLVKIFLYKEELNKFKFVKSYEICVGTSCIELGFSTQNFIDLNEMTYNSEKNIVIDKDSLKLTYEFPKEIDIDFLKSNKPFKSYNLEPDNLIEKPCIILINSDFDFNNINKYVENYHTYGVKEL